MTIIVRISQPPKQVFALLKRSAGGVDVRHDIRLATRCCGLMVDDALAGPAWALFKKTPPRGTKGGGFCFIRAPPPQA